MRSSNIPPSVSNIPPSVYNTNPSVSNIPPSVYNTHPSVSNPRVGVQVDEALVRSVKRPAEDPSAVQVVFFFITLNPRVE